MTITHQAANSLSAGIAPFKVTMKNDSVKVSNKKQMCLITFIFNVEFNAIKIVPWFICHALIIHDVMHKFTNSIQLYLLLL